MILFLFSKVEAPVFASLVSAFDYIEEQNRKILNYGWVNFPLAYTQVATLSVYVYMSMSIFGSQYLQVPEAYKSAAYNDTISFSDKPPFDKHTPDFFFPFYAIFEFIGYMGWIKVAEALLNPFGDDDEDFEINYLIDRNVQVHYIQDVLTSFEILRQKKIRQIERRGDQCLARRM